MPQHWVNVFIGLILIVAVLGDIWLRQEGLLARLGQRLSGRKESTGMTEPLVEMRGIQKSFGAVRALADVNLRLYPGEILGLVGDNSAGKSTLMKIMTGAYQRDEGEVLVEGAPTHFKSPHESREVGIEMIYQDFALCGNLDVAANIFLGRWPTKGWFVDRKADGGGGLGRAAAGSRSTSTMSASGSRACRAGGSSRWRSRARSASHPRC